MRDNPDSPFPGTFAVSRMTQKKRILTLWLHIRLTEERAPANRVETRRTTTGTTGGAT